VQINYIIDKFYPSMEKAIRKAGAYLLSGLGTNPELSEGDLDNTSDISSIYDKGSNAILMEELLGSWFSQADFPEQLVMISEENRMVMLAQKQAEGWSMGEYDASDGWDGFTLACDPLCGSIPFAHGIPDFIVSIALLYKTEVVIGMVYDPSRNELFHAKKGEGAFMNDTPIHPSSTTRVDRAMVSIEHEIYRKAPPEKVQELARSILRSRTAGTCGLELSYVACGRLDAMLKVDQAFYDYIAGSFILQQAGGDKDVLLRLDGSRRLFPIEYLNQRLGFVASNGIIGKEFIKWTKEWTWSAVKK